MNRSNIKEWVPPKIWKWLRNKSVGLKTVDEWPDQPSDGWQYAANEAARFNDENASRLRGSKVIGMLPEENLAELPESTIDVHHWISQFALIAARASIGKAGLRLLDFGGAFGNHAIALKRLLPGLKIDYCVFDLAEFCAVGKETNQDIHFISDISVLGSNYDLVYASSSLHYFKDWRRTSSQLCELSSKYLYISRTPFIFNTPSYITVQQAYRTKYAGWVFEFQDFVNEIQNHNMTLQEIFVNSMGNPIRSNKETNIHLGLLFEKNLDK